MTARREDHDALNRPRRFWKSASVGSQTNDGFPVLLDGRAARSPASRTLALPTSAAAAIVAQEWADAGEHLNFGRMPATRLAFTAIDRVHEHRQVVADEVARYAASDLLCYFAEAPSALVERQDRLWSPVLAWAEADLDLLFARTSGIVHRPQPAATIERVRALAMALDDFGLAGLAWAASLFGSAILALALQRGRLQGEAAFDLSRVDETFQAEQWGEDDEAREREQGLRREARLLQFWFDSLNTA